MFQAAKSANAQANRQLIPPTFRLAIEAAVACVEYMSGPPGLPSARCHASLMIVGSAAVFVPKYSERNRHQIHEP